MEDIDSALTMLRLHCSRLNIHRNIVRQLQRRFTEVTLWDLPTDTHEPILSLFARTTHILEYWTESSPINTLARNQSLADDVTSALLELFATLSPHFLIPQGWKAEFENARAKDLEDLEAVICATVEDEGSLTCIHELDSKSLEEFIIALMDVITRCSDETRLETLKNVYRSLKGLKTGFLRDLTSRIHILGDRPLVTGALSDFWLAAIPGSGGFVTAKIVRGNKGPDGPHAIMREAQLLAQLQHPHIMSMIGTAMISDALASVSPWIKWNAKQYIKRNIGTNIIKILWEAAQALDYIHSLDIVHNNLQTPSILISNDGHAILSNFMFSHPEPLNDEEKTGHFDPSIHRQIEWPYLGECAEISMGSKADDIQGFSEIFCELLTNVTQGYLTIKTHDKQFPEDWFLPDGYLAATRQALWKILVLASCPDHKSRINSQQLVARLEVLCQLPEIDKVAMERDVQRQVVEEEDPVLPDLGGEIKVLGTQPVAAGGFCDVWMGEWLGQKRVALKAIRVYEVPEQIRKRFTREAVIWYKLRHSNILPFLGIVDHGPSSYMVSPWQANSNVLKYAAEINPSVDRFRLLVDAAEGLLYLHTHFPPIIHGDLKCANILVRDNGRACLMDFGLSKISHETTTASLQDSGSQRYMAPELFDASHKTFASDVYAFGHVILELTSGEKPYYNMVNPHQVMMAIMRGERAARPYNETTKKWLLDPIWEGILSMTEHDAAERPSTEHAVQLTRTFSSIFGKDVPLDIMMDSITWPRLVPDSHSESTPLPTPDIRHAALWSPPLPWQLPTSSPDSGDQ